MARSHLGPVIELRSLPDEPRARRLVERSVALALGIPLELGRALVAAAPVTLPLPDGEKARALSSELLAAGAVVASLELGGATPGCADHEELVALGSCDRCKACLCTVCTVAEARSLCRACTAKAARSRRFYLLRVAVLSVILLGVVLYALRDVTSRSARTDWKTPVTVAIVIVAREPLEDDVGERMRDRAIVLGTKLFEEKERYRKDGQRPFSFEVIGPVSDQGAVPEPPSTEGLADAARYTWDLRSFTNRVDDAAKLNSRAYDSRIYILATRPVRRDRKAIEGASQMGGRVGVVKVELDGTMTDFALIVAAHELFHTLGATDKYDADGNPLIPDGLPEPDRQPLFPQRYVELMARHRAKSATNSVPPKTLDELSVGALTAREIRWY